MKVLNTYKTKEDDIINPTYSVSVSHNAHLVSAIFILDCVKQILDMVSFYS